MNMKRVVQGAAIVALVAAVAVPGTAMALGRRGGLGLGPKGSLGATASAQVDQRLAALKDRIVAVLQLRKARFDLAATRVADRIQKVGTIADSVEKAGGDVSGVGTSLQTAQSQLDQANADEATAVQMFQAVPSATDKRAAFRAARAQGRTARIELNTARLTLRNAILNLRAIANGLKGAQ